MNTTKNENYIILKNIDIIEINSNLPNSHNLIILTTKLNMMAQYHMYYYITICQLVKFNPNTGFSRTTSFRETARDSARQNWRH